jgi:hypothetical protein
MHIGGVEEGKVLLCIEYMTPRFEMRKVLVTHDPWILIEKHVKNSTDKVNKHVYFKSATALGRLILYRLGYKIHEGKIYPLCVAPSSKTCWTDGLCSLASRLLRRWIDFVLCV